MMKGCMGHKICALLVIIGAINWGLIGAFNFNLVNTLLGSVTWLERTVYILVGLAGIMMLVGCRCKKCKECCKVEEKKA